MKKYLLFSVLSVLLSMFYIVQAQEEQECCFWLENANPHHPVYDLYSLNPISVGYNTWEYYYFKFENNCNLDPHDKVSIDWSFEMDGQPIDLILLQQLGVEIEMKNPMDSLITNDGFATSKQLKSGQGLSSLLGCPDNTDYPGGLGGPNPNSYCTNTYPNFSYYTVGANNLYNFMYVHFLEYASENNLIRFKVNRKNYKDFKFTFKLVLRKNGEEYQNEYRIADGTTHYYIGGKLSQFDRVLSSFTLEEQTYSEGAIGVCSGETISVGLDPDGNTYDFVENVFIPGEPITRIETVRYYNQSDDCIDFIDFIDSVVTYTLTWSPMPTKPTAEDVVVCGAGDLVFNASHEYSTLYPGVYDDHITYNWYSDAELTTLVHTGATYILADQPVDTHVELWVAATIAGCEGPATHVVGDVYKIPEITLTNPDVLCPETGTKEIIATIANLYTPYNVTAVWTGASQTGFDDTGLNYVIYADVDVTDECNKEYSYSVTITDENTGCSATASSSFILNDTEAPTFTAPADVTVHRKDDCSIDTMATAAGTGIPTDLEDNCTAATALVVTYADFIDVSGTCPSNITITRTWTVTDHCGNATSKDQVITVMDNTAPTFTVPGDITIYRDADCNYDADPDETGRPTAVADNCTPLAELDVVYNDVQETSTVCESNLTITRTWTVTDACGNATSATQTITVEDNTAPTFDVPANITVYRDADCNYNVNPDETGKPTAVADNCTAADDLQVVYTDDVAQTLGECEKNLTITRTWTVTDECGNATSKDQIITVEDDTAPTFTAPDDIAICKDGSGNYDASVAVTGDITNVADNCSAEADITVTHVDNLDHIGKIAEVGRILRTFTIEDECGNTATHVQTITLNPAPIATIAATPDDFCLPTDGSAQEVVVTITPTTTGTYTYSITEPTLLTTPATDATVTVEIEVSGEYTFTGIITDTETGCKSDPVTVVAVAHDFPDFDIETIQDKVGCRDDVPEFNASVRVTANPNYTYSIEPQDGVVFDPTTYVFSNMLLKTYTITATHITSDCEYSQEYTVQFSDAMTPEAQLFLNGEDNDIAVCWTADMQITTLVLDVNNILGHEYLFSIIAPAHVTVHGSNYITIAQPGIYLIGGSVFNVTTGCGDTTWHYVYANAIPDVDITTTGACIGEEITLTANAAPALADPHNYTYKWTSNLTGATVLGTEATLTQTLTEDVTFTVEVTANYNYPGLDPFTCSATENIDIVPYPAPEFVLTKLSSVEFCNSITLGKIGITTGWDPTHTWTAQLEGDTPFAVTTQEFEVAVGGNYTVTAVSENGCTYTQTILVDSLKIGFDAILHADTEPLVPHIDKSDDLAFCWTDVDKTVYHEVRYTNNPIFEYQYTINTPVQIAQQNSQYSYVTEPGDYMLIGWVMNLTTGCRSNDDILYVYAVQTPEFEKSPDQNICAGEEVKIGIRPTGTFDVEWTGIGLTAPTDSVTITPAMYGANPTYTATVEVSNNHAKLACKVTEQVVITINPTPEIDAVAVTHVDCHGDNTGKISLTVTGGTGHTYAWAYSETSGGATTPLTAATNPLEDIVAGYYTVTVTNAEGCEVVSSEIAVNQPAEALTATVVPTSPLCSDGTGTIVVTATGGTPTYSYAWDPNTSDNTATVTGLATGTYTVTVSDARGCKFIGSADIVIPAQIVKDPSSTITDVACHGGSTGAINFVATGGTGALQYSINSGSTYQDNGLFTGLFSGNYTITVKDANNCVVNFTDQIVDQPDEALAATITQVNINCHGGATGEATVNATGGTLPYQYLWSTGATTKTISGLPAGPYSVTVTDGKDCTLETSVTITELDEITLASSTIKHVECKGTSTGGITVVAQGGSGSYEYSINNGPYQSTGQFTLLEDGHYVITVRDSVHKTCTKDFNFDVEEPVSPLTLNASVTDPIACHGEDDATVTLIAADGWGKYTYTFGGVESTTGIYSPIAAATGYTYQVVDSLGCIITGTLDVDQPAELIITSISVTDPIDCYGEEAEVTIQTTGGTGTITYTLGTLSNDTGVFIVPAGDYAYSVKDENECEVRSTLDFTVIEPDELTVDATITTPVKCYGDNATVTLTVAGGTGPTYTYTLGTLTNNDGVFNVPAGLYKYCVEDASGCVTDTVEINVTQPDPLTATAAVTTPILCNGGNATVTITAEGGTGAYSYTFNSNTNPTGEFTTTAGTYTYTVKDENACETASATIEVTQPAALDVNPDIVPVKCNSGADGSIELHTSGGTTPYTYAWSPNTTETTEVVTGLTAGNYTVTVTDANGCELIEPLTVGQPDPIVITFTPVSGTTICNESTISVTVSSTGGTGTTHTYEWSNDAVVANVTLGVGKYYVTATDENGCEKVDSITIESYPVPTITSDEDLQYCNNAAFDVIATSSVTGGWSAQLYDENGPIGSTQNAINTTSITFNVDNSHSDTELYIVFTFTDGNGCVYTDTTNKIKISTEPLLRIYYTPGPNSTDNYATINQYDPTQFYFIVDDLCSYGDDLRLSIDYQIYKDGVLIDTFSNYFSEATSMNFYMGLQNTGLMPPTYQPIDYSLNQVESHFPYAASNGAVLGSYQFDFFTLRFLKNREGTISIDHFKEPGEYRIDFQLVSHYKDALNNQAHGNLVYVNMIGGRVGGNQFYEGTYFTRVWSTNSMTYTVEPAAAPAPTQPTVYERDEAKDPTTLSVDMRIYPNPAAPAGDVKIELTNLSSNGVLTIANVNGLVLEQYQILDLNNRQEIVVRVNDYAPGIYFVTYRAKEGIVTKKLVIQSR